MLRDIIETAVFISTENSHKSFDWSHGTLKGPSQSLNDMNWASS